MNAVELFGLLLETTLATSTAIAVVLLLRRRVRRAFGPGLAYATWLLVPAALIAVLLPAREVTLDLLPGLAAAPVTQVTVPVEAAAVDPALVLYIAWLLGAAAMGLRMLAQQRAFARMLGPLQQRDDGSYQSAAIAGLPAALGLMHPRIVVPADFDDRYDAHQRALMREHERIHIRRGDLHLNAVVALSRCMYWFNPLVHVAALHFRHDQELACDQKVIEHHPQHRRAYGEAMLHTQLASQPLPFGCHWGFSHPLRERIEMLKQNPKSGQRVAAGAALIATLAIAVGAAAWAAQPAGMAIATSAPAVAQAEQLKGGHVVGLSVRIDDSGPMTASGHVIPGRETVYDFDHAGQHWEVALTVTPRADGTYSVATRILRDGKEQATPGLVVKAGEDAGITVGERTGDRMVKGLELGLVVQRADSAAYQGDAGRRSQESTPPPGYPAAAAKGNIGGRVVLLLDVDVQGRVTGVEVEHAEPAGVFDQATMEAARDWTFNPATENGVAVPSRVRVPVDFAPDAPAAEVPNVNMMPAAPGQS